MVFEVRGSVSKTVHGAGNLLEVHIMGAKLGASWSFENPDELQLARGTNSESFRRETCLMGSQQSPYHGLGWLEGYIEIIRQGILILQGLPHTPPPDLKDSLDVVEALLKLEKF